MSSRVFKYRLYPTHKQERTLLSTLNTCRHTYNDALEQRKNTYKELKKSTTYNQQAKYLTQNKNEYQVEIYSQVLQNVLKRLDNSYQKFFDFRKKLKQGIKTRRVGLPRFKNYNRYRSFTYPQSGFRLSDDNKRIKLSKIGSVKLRYSRPLEGKLKRCQVVRDVDQWYVIFTCEQKDKFIKHNNPNSIVGIDVGIKTLCALSTGEIVENPKLLKKSAHLLKRAQRRLSRKPTKKSIRREKQRIKVARIHRRIRFQRDDYLHKTSRWLVDKFETIVFEDLTITKMMRDHKYAKGISDCSWNKLVQYTTYKAERAGGRVVLVDPRDTSQMCSECGEIVLKDLNVRTHKCPHCGHVEDRDLNASKNILKLGSSTVGHAGIYNALGDSTSTLLTSGEQVESLSRESAGI